MWPRRRLASSLNCSALGGPSSKLPQTQTSRGGARCSGKVQRAIGIGIGLEMNGERALGFPSTFIHLLAAYLRYRSRNPRSRNASFSTICTLARAHVGDVLALGSSRQALKDIMAEVLTVARASLTPSPAVEQELSDAVIDRIIANENPQSVFRPSMLVDLDLGRPMEVEAIVGGVLRRARAKGVPTPKLDLIYAGLSVIQSNLIKGRA